MHRRGIGPVLKTEGSLTLLFVYVQQDNTLVMSLEDKPVLELPLAAVSQCVLPGTGTVKNEVEMQVRGFVRSDVQTYQTD